MVHFADLIGQFCIFRKKYLINLGKCAPGCIGGLCYATDDVTISVAESTKQPVDVTMSSNVIDS